MMQKTFKYESLPKKWNYLAMPDIKYFYYYNNTTYDEYNILMVIAKIYYKNI